MKRSLAFLLSMSCTSPLMCAESAPEQTARFLSPEQVLREADPLPDEYRGTQEWVTSEAETFRALQLPEMHNHADWIKNREAVAALLQARRLKSLSKHNYVFTVPDASQDSEHPAVVRFAGLNSTLSSKASSVRIDSGPTQNMCDIVDGRPIGYKANVLILATYDTTPVHQHTSMLAYFLAMRKNLAGSKVQPVQTWVAHYGSDQELCDANYVVVQPRLDSNRYKLLSDLPDADFESVIHKGILPSLADAVESGAWNLSKDNLWIDTETNTFVITDLEGPNNEGWGANAGTNPRWGRAIFSYAGDGTSCHAWKWQHNIRCGYDAVAAMLPEELQQEWGQLKARRALKD